MYVLNVNKYLIIIIIIIMIIIIIIIIIKDFQFFMLKE